MKRHLAIGFLLLLALASCHSPRREARQMMRRAEQLFDTLPDSTARLIDSVLRMPVLFSEQQRMDMALLQGEALFGDRGQEIPPLMDDEYFDDKPFLVASPELERAANYYARKNLYGRAAHAALYSGFVQQHYGEKQIALQSFKDAERYGEFAKDSLSVARAQSKIGKMLFDDFTYNDALALFKSSEKGIGNRLVEKAMVLNMVSVCHLVQGDHENAEKCLQQSLELAQKCHNDKVKRKVMNNYSVLYRIQGKHEQAIACLRQTIGDHLDDAKVFVAYLNLGKTFMVIGSVDSASYYLGRVESLLSAANIDAATKVSAYEALSSFAELQDNPSLALAYHKHIEELLSKIMFQRQEQSIYRIQQQYDYENLQNVLNRKILIRHRIIFVISILLLLAAVAILVFQYRHAQMLEAEAEMKLQIDTMKQNLRQMVKSSVMDEEVALRIRMMLTAHHISKQVKDPKNDWTPLLNRVMNGKDNLFEAVQSTVEMVYPRLYAILLENYPNLTETEAKICLLSFCDLSNKEIAELLGLRPNTVNQSRSSLRKKMHLNADNKMKEELRNAISNDAWF